MAPIDQERGHVTPQRRGRVADGEEQPRVPVDVWMGRLASMLPLREVRRARALPAHGREGDHVERSGGTRRACGAYTMKRRKSQLPKLS